MVNQTCHFNLRKIVFNLTRMQTEEIKRIVLDIDETLVTRVKKEEVGAIRMTKSVYVKPRPLLKQFIAGIESLRFDIVIWTAGAKSYAEAIASHFCIQSAQILGGDSCTLVGNNVLVKDLRKLTKWSPENVLIIDNCTTCFAEQPLNGLQIPAYLGDDDDDFLELVLDHVRMFAMRDLASVICSFKKQIQYLQLDDFGLVTVTDDSDEPDDHHYA